MNIIYCLGGKTLLICGPKEAKLSNIPFWGPLRGPQKGVLDSFGFLWAANQPGFSPQAVNIHHPTELLCFKFWLGMQPHILPFIFVTLLFRLISIGWVLELDCDRTMGHRDE